MKKMIAMILAAALLLGALPALAETAEWGEGLTIEVTGMAWLSSWEGAREDGVRWLRVDATLTNWDSDTRDIEGQATARFVYADRYAYEGEAVFGADRIGPLFDVKGAFVFRLPLRVAQADPADCALRFTVDGREIDVPLSVGALPAATRETGFDTPEDAVRAYLSAFGRGDLGAMLAACAIETYAARFDAARFYARMGSLNVNTTQLYLPPTGAFSTALNAENRRVYLTGLIRMQYMALAVNPEATEIKEGSGFYGLTDPETKAFDQARLDALFIRDDGAVQDGFGFDGAVYCVSPLLFSSFRRVRSIQQSCAVNGMDEMRSFAAPFSLDGEAWLFFADAARIGDRWYVYEPGSYAAGQLSSGAWLFYRGGVVPAQALDEAEELKAYLRRLEEDAALAGEIDDMLTRLFALDLMDEDQAALEEQVGAILTPVFNKLGLM